MWNRRKAAAAVEPTPINPADRTDWMVGTCTITDLQGDRFSDEEIGVYYRFAIAGNGWHMDLHPTSGTLEWTFPISKEGKAGLGVFGAKGDLISVSNVQLTRPGWPFRVTFSKTCDCCGKTI